ncbi:MAG: viroplasmin family protein [Lachnospira sp.]
MAKKYYAVRIGKVPGVYYTWDECKANVHGFPAAEYKSFPTYEEAQKFINNELISDSSIGQNVKYECINDYAFVDGSYNVSTGVYGYGGFLIHDNEKYVLSGNGNDVDLASMRNVAGEILGSQAAIAKAIELGIKEINIYYDYQGIKMWATGEWKRNRKGTVAYYEYIQSIKDKIKINFIKVKGHSGIEGNEEADLLAKKAAGIT